MSLRLKDRRHPEYKCHRPFRMVKYETMRHVLHCQQRKFKTSALYTYHQVFGIIGAKDIARQRDVRRMVESQCPTYDLCVRVRKVQREC